MLRFDFSSSQRPRLRGKPFKLFSDELPIIDFEKQHLLEKLAEQDFNKRSDILSKRKTGRQEQDSHSLPGLGGPDWDNLSGSDRQSIKSESRLQALKPDMPEIHRKIRERLGLQDKSIPSSTNYYQRSVHRSHNLKSMPNSDEYKKFIQWPRLPSQQIVSPGDIQYNLLNSKGEFDDKSDAQSRKETTVPKEQHEHKKYRLKHNDHAKLDLPIVRLNARTESKKDVETQTPRDLHSLTYNTTRCYETETYKDGNKANKDENVITTGQTTKQAISILKKNADTKTDFHHLETALSSTIQNDKANEPDIINTLVHCDIPRNQLLSKKSVFNAYKGEAMKSENKSSKKVNFTETKETDTVSHISKPVPNNIKTDGAWQNIISPKNAKETVSNTQDSHQPKLVSGYNFQRKDMEQIARKHLLHDHATKRHRLQSMMKHFRKIRGRQNLPHTINLDIKAARTDSEQPIKARKDEVLKTTGRSSLSSDSDNLTPSSVTPRINVDHQKNESQPATSRLDMSKSQSLHEDIETCVQVRKLHKVNKRHKVTKHTKTDEISAEAELSGNHGELENVVDRSLNGNELLKFYRLWNRRRRNYGIGLRTIDEPPTVTDYFSQKRLNGLSKLGAISETEGSHSEHA